MSGDSIMSGLRLCPIRSLLLWRDEMENKIIRTIMDLAIKVRENAKDRLKSQKITIKENGELDIEEEYYK